MLFLGPMKFWQLFIFSFILISLFTCVILHQTLKYEKLKLPFGVSCLESVAFDCKGEGPCKTREIPISGIRAKS